MSHRSKSVIDPGIDVLRWGWGRRRRWNLSEQALDCREASSNFFGDEPSVAQETMQAPHVVVGDVRSLAFAITKDNLYPALRV